MSVPRVILGAPADLEAALAADVAERRRDDPLAPLAILVGSTLARPYLARRLAERTGGWIGVDVLTQAELALRLGEAALQAQGRRPLGALGERVLTGLVAANAGGRFAQVDHTAGFADALHRVRGDLRRAGLGPADLAREPAQGELARLLAARERRRAAFYDADDALAEADPARLSAEALYVHGLWSPSPALRRVLRALAERVDLVVLLPHAEDAADDIHAPFRSWLAALGAVPERATSDVGAPRAGALSALQAVAPGSGVAPDAGVRLLSAPDPAREVRAAVRACLAWAREGVPFHEMALVYRQEQPYRALAESVLREASIPAYLDQPTPLLEQPVGRRAVALLELVDSPLERSAVMAFLADAVLPQGTWDDAGGVPVARWDALSRRAGVVAGAAQWAQRLAALREAEQARAADDEPEPLGRRLEAIDGLGAFVAELDLALRARPERAGWAAHLRFARGLLERYLEDAGPLADALGELEVLDELEPEVSFERFRAVAVDVIRSLRSPDVLGTRPGGFARRGVNVLSASSVRGLSFRAVCVLGLADGEFPPPPRQDPLLLDAERARLNAAHGWELALRAFGPDPEPLTFHAAVHAARERLVLSYARTGGTDPRPRYPSVFLRHAAERLVGRRVGVQDIDREAPVLTGHLVRDEASRVGAPAPPAALTPTEYDRTLLERAPGVGLAVVEAGAPSVRRARVAHAEREREELTSWDGIVAGGPSEAAALAERAGLTGTLSPTALETYAECPYRFFLGRVLRLREAEDPEELERLTPLERGNLVHEVLERFLSELGDGERPRPEQREPQLARLHEIADAACRERERHGLTGHALLWRFDQRRLHDDLRRWWELEADDPEAPRFDRGAYELRFGPARAGEAPTSPLSTDEPVAVDVGGGVVPRFAGRVDRVDWRERPAAFRVIDYKTGKARHQAGSLAGGKQLQLPIYLLGAAHALGLPPEAGDAEYLHPTRRGRFTRVGFSGAALAERRDDLDRLLRDLHGGIAGGLFHLVPGERTCRHCAFDGLCPSDRHAQAARKADDPRARAHAALAEIA